jgi:hypothetical protein
MDAASPYLDADMLRAQLRAYQAWAADARRQTSSLREAGASFELVQHAKADCELLQDKVDELQRRLRHAQTH